MDNDSRKFSVGFFWDTPAFYVTPSIVFVDMSDIGCRELSFSFLIFTLSLNWKVNVKE
jgi:hypothetical protein